VVEEGDGVYVRSKCIITISKRSEESIIRTVASSSEVSSGDRQRQQRVRKEDGLRIARNLLRSSGA
jgi:hypothetical protein